ncbi:hypothetical protein TRFO_00851 [Tritrichomonas foetus]|uniref:Kelch motif family protein n=1 Tax=Tritrichomonas foetus TaxID=1144522 RepID=A0A1J4L2B8_9EUKA|nr:hypothetical protein TRFO_00851 [Tritrichomonas foetus]|eukprot:OHT17595.1 hypothetical protein TRFO_00851 [Tritrichomonas foetus]
MLDIPDPPSSQPIDFPDDSKGKLSINPQNNRTFCFHSNKVFLFSENLYYFQSANKLSWKKVNILPFLPRRGQSITSTASGLAFFGGSENTALFNDLWIFHATEWFYVTTEIPARFNHAAASDSEGHLVIYGGQGLDQKIFNDLYVIDIATQETRKVEIPNLPAMINHSLTLLDDGRLFLFGGELVPTPTGRDIKYVARIIDVNNNTMEVIDTPFENNNIQQPHYSALIYGMVFIFGVPSQSIWMFNLTNNIWIPLSLPPVESQRVFPAFLFISDVFSENKCLHIVDEKLDKLFTIPIFTKPPPADLNNDSQYITFLKKNLLDGCKVFENYQVPSGTTQRLTENRNAIIPKLARVIPGDGPKRIFMYQDQINLIKELEIQARNVETLMKSVGKNLGQAEVKKVEKNVNPNCIHETITKINELRKNSQNELSKLEDEADSLSKQIEIVTFMAMNPIHEQPTQKSVAFPPNCIKLIQKSKQLANEIQFEQFRLEEEKKKRDTTNFLKKSKILNIRDQLWSLGQSENQLNEQLINVQTKYFETIRELTKWRNSELTYQDRNDRMNAERYVRLPVEQNEMAQALDELKKLKQSVDLTVKDLDPKEQLKSEGSFVSKLNAIKENMNNIQQWAETSKKWIEVGSMKSMPSQHSHLNRKKAMSIKKRGTVFIPNEFITSFSESIGNTDKFLGDLQKILKKIQADVNNIM